MNKSVIIGGDFNAQTGYKGHVLHPEVMGANTKGKLTSNGEELLEFVHHHQLLLTNTLFTHKMAHTTTWKSPKIPILPQRNPYRNQIDSILVSAEPRIKIHDSHSYSGTYVNSDHRLVRMSMLLQPIIYTNQDIKEIQGSTTTS